MHWMKNQLKVSVFASILLASAVSDASANPRDSLLTSQSGYFAYPASSAILPQVDEGGGGSGGGQGAPSGSEQSQSDLAKATQNPLADLISVPFQTNVGFDVGPKGRTQTVTNIQPVIPINLNEEWNLITRTIFPLIHQPPMYPGGDRE